MHAFLVGESLMRQADVAGAPTARRAAEDVARHDQALAISTSKGEARMVDVSDKAATQRTARAEGFVAMAPATLALVEKGEAKKGDVLAAARIAGIMAAKKTHELIPLCHPLAITKATVEFEPSRDPPASASPPR